MRFSNSSYFFIEHLAVGGRFTSELFCKLRYSAYEIVVSPNPH
jgi:hypothetical protein